MRVVFAGSAPFSLPVLDCLDQSDHSVTLVLTAPDRPGSRGRPAPRPVLDLARELGLLCRQPDRITIDSWQELSRGVEAEVLVVASYGLMLPAAVLGSLSRGGLGVHPSLLPRHRGASPVPAAILAGDSQSGVSIFQMERRLDAGPVLAQRAVSLTAITAAPQLGSQLAEEGGALLVEVLDRLESGAVRAVPQEESLATYSPKLSRADGELEWSLTALEIDRRVRALRPWPGTTVPIAGVRVKLLDGAPQAAGALSPPAEPGSLLGEGPGGVLVATGDRGYWCRLLQPPGSRPVEAAAYLRGRHVKILP